MNICILPCAPSYIVNLPLLTWVSTTSYSDIVLISRFTLSRAVRLGKSYVHADTHDTHTYAHTNVHQLHSYLPCMHMYVHLRTPTRVLLAFTCHTLAVKKPCSFHFYLWHQFPLLDCLQRFHVHPRSKSYKVVLTVHTRGEGLAVAWVCL